MHRYAYPFERGDAASFVDQTAAIGYFDGVHLGHQHVIGLAVQEAEAMGVAASVLTFDPHPREALGFVSRVKVLTPLDEKLRRFAELGVEHTYILRFDERLSKLTPEQFVDEVLVPMRVRVVAVGFNFTFGHQGKGTSEHLGRIGGDRFRTLVARPYERDGVKVSSTVVREKLLHGEVEAASELLGRPYRLKGTVVHGEARGRTIGFPTANLGLSAPYLIPGNGVYAVQVHIRGGAWRGMMNIGTKPTFHAEAQEPVLEVHLLGFDGDLYGEAMEVDFVGFIRPEQRFSGVNELVEQIRADIRRAETQLFRN